MINIHEILGTNDAGKLLEADYKYVETFEQKTPDGKTAQLHQFIAEGMYPCLYVFNSETKDGVEGYDLVLFFRFPASNYHYRFLKAMNGRCLSEFIEVPPNATKDTPAIRVYRFEDKVFKVAPSVTVEEQKVKDFIDKMNALLTDIKVVATPTKQDN